MKTFATPMLARPGLARPGLARLASTTALAVAVVVSVAACSSPPPTPAASTVPDAAPTSAALPPVVVHRSPTCGCCEVWVEHMREAGFTVQVVDHENMAAQKARAGVPDAVASCHTAEVGGYFVEGHVPPAIVRKLLRERPAARGIAVPGMPEGSPGMESPSGNVDPYSVLLVAEDGSATEFSRHGP